MVTLGNGKKLPTKIRVPGGVATMQTLRFYFGNSPIRKKDADKAVREKLKQLLENIG